MKQILILAAIAAMLFTSAYAVKENAITADDNMELAAIIELKNPHDDKIKAFAEKYSGQVIVFDGCTAYVDFHGSYKTRFDYLIYVGNYDDKSNYGPIFQFRDVNYYDLKLTGEDIPDSFGEGLNIRIFAEVGPYNQESGVFQLIPVAISMRGK